MLIAICSDSHDNIANINKFLNYCAQHQIKTIIHCGDITEDETKKYFTANFTGKINFAAGNAEISVQKQLKCTNRFQKIKRRKIPCLDLEFDKIKISACHAKSKAIQLAKKNIYNIVFYGHNHKPWQEKINQTIVANPGNLAGMFYRATFAVYNTDNQKLELKILDLIN